MPVGFPPEPTEFCITDVGSTTTKAVLFRRETGWRFDRCEAATTVERPHEDVLVGARQALGALEQATGVDLLKDGHPGLPFLSTSSAGGGLAIVVTGLVRAVTSRSAERVALGAGAIVLDVIAMDDGRTPYEKIQALKRLRPDMVLLAGGFDGEAISGPAFLAELVRESGLRPKLSRTALLPIVYAGNVNARDFVRETLGDGFLFHPVDNLRPASDRENLEPARQAIHDLFMDHVMSQAPGYERLTTWVQAPILPTPAAVGRILALASREMKGRILAIDIGGATTDVFTAQAGSVVRTVSANLGMSYSILNVVHTAGVEAIEAHLGHGISRQRLWDKIGEKYLRPTSLPQTPEEIAVEQAVAAVAIREAVKDHQRVLAGVSLNRGTDELRIQRFGPTPRRSGRPRDPFMLKGYDLIIGSGGFLSHSPREAAALALTRALPVRGHVELAVDRAFIFPHLGVLASVAPQLAVQLFWELGLVRLGQTGARGASSAKGSASSGASTPREQPVQAALHSATVTPGAVAQPEPLRLRRELVIPGEVLVRVGDRVMPETVVARSSRQFLRPFFLDVAAALSVAPQEAAAYIVKKVGDEIAPGELLARRKVSLMLAKEFHSPVAGRIERILPTGTILAREKPEDAMQLVVVRVAEDLQIYPERIRPFLRVTPGQSVEAGQWIAAELRPGKTRFSRSPARGRVKDVNLAYGVVTIEPLLEQLDVQAWMPGQVVEVTEWGALVENEAISLDGVWGQGGEVWGQLSLEGGGPGRIAVRDYVAREDLERLQAEGTTGLVAGGLHLEDVLALRPSLTLAITEGFGEQRLRGELRQVLEGHAGRLILLDGTTELRVGVRRPRIILPLE